MGAIPPIRFEYAPNQYRELAHPAAHLHIGRYPHNRWPSAITLGPTTFALLIAKMYYATPWASCSSFHGAAVTTCVDNTLLAELNNTRVVSDFSDKERQSLHFGRNMAQVVPSLEK